MTGRQATKTETILCHVWNENDVDDLVTCLINYGRLLESKNISFKISLLDYMGQAALKQLSPVNKKEKKKRRYCIPSKQRERLVYAFPNKCKLAIQNRKRR